MSDTPQPGYWQASDGQWYPPQESASTPTPPRPASGGGSNPGGLLAFLGWTVACLGILGCFVVFDNLREFDAEFSDYLLGIQGPLVTAGVGLAAAAAGHILSRRR